jgi:hypothetical protein
MPVRAHVDQHLALADERVVELADLVALRQVGVEVVLAVEGREVDLALSPSPVRTACATQNSLITGSMPGIAASTKETLALGSAPKAVEAPEKSLAFEATWAWTSMPITSSQSARRRRDPGLGHG